MTVEALLVPPWKRPLRVGSFFSGIGGLDLGLERAGMQVIWQSEVEPYASRVLAKHWPDVPNLGDITSIDWSSIDRPDLVCGGYPCPAFSQAARGRNVAPDLWPWMRDAIAVLRPRYVLIENVAAHLGRGFSGVLADLDALGFDAEWATLTACAVGAPHTRRRLFALAYTDGIGEPVLAVDGEVAGMPALAGDRRDGWFPTADDARADDGVPHRVDRCRVLGNAVVPQLAEHVGRLIVNAHRASYLQPVTAPQVPRRLGDRHLSVPTISDAARLVAEGEPNLALAALDQRREAADAARQSPPGVSQ